MNAVKDQVTLGVVLMCHSHLDTAARTALIWADGGAEVVIHVDSKADTAERRDMQAALAAHPRIRFSRRHACHWGRFSLIEATQSAAAKLLDEAPAVTHVFLASGSCLPLRPVAELIDYLGRDPSRDYIESVAVEDVFWAMGGLNEERFTSYFPFDWRNQRKLFDLTLNLQRKLGVKRRLPSGLVPHLGSQWWCLTRNTLRAILNDPRRAEFDRFFRMTWIPDESYFQTLARVYSQNIESRSLTLSRFDHRGKPYMLYDNHLRMLEESGCFVARKVWPQATGLQQHFPRPSPPDSTDREPDPSRIERLFSRATALRTLGRPGLYMQSRFPQKDTGKGKTAAPYAVLQGFSDVVPGFETWLAQRVDADVHGHIFAPERVEFAGSPNFGPGCLSTEPALRDYDPKAFLTSLTRGRERLQVFQHSSRDNQALNWFMATDDNARLMIITGAWIVPLYLSDMPFSEVRRCAAHLQRAEIEQFKILNSHSPRARVHIWDLAEFAARPAAILRTALAEIEPAAADFDDLPPLHDLSGMGTFLQRLRNAGLRPALTGHFPLTAPQPQNRPAS